MRWYAAAYLLAEGKTWFASSSPDLAGRPETTAMINETIINNDRREVFAMIVVAMVCDLLKNAREIWKKAKYTHIWSLLVQLHKVMVWSEGFQEWLKTSCNDWEPLLPHELTCVPEVKGKNYGLDFIAVKTTGFRTTLWFTAHVWTTKVFIRAVCQTWRNILLYLTFFVSWDSVV